MPGSIAAGFWFSSWGWSTGELLGVAAACVMSGAVVAPQRRRTLAGTSDDTVALPLGLDRKRRSVVMRAVRTAAPSADPRLQYVELSEARRRASQVQTAIWGVPIVIVVAALLAGANLHYGDVPTSAFIAVVGLITVGVAAREALIARGAVRYLERVGYDPVTLRPRVA